VVYELAKPGQRAEGDPVRSGAHLRIGAGWFACEDWGAWTGRGEARLAFVFPDEDCLELAAYLRLKGAPGKGSALEVAANFSEMVFSVSLAPNEIKWFNLVFSVSQPVSAKELNFRASDLVDLAQLTEGSDQRRIGCGVCAFGVASRSDMEGRLAMVEAAAFASGRVV
jgi:hypothetical protein